MAEDFTDAVFRLDLMGAFRLFGPNGTRIDLASRKGMAMVAMLAMASSGERTRAWLQDRLWGSRQRVQAQQSLRREIATLRAGLSIGGVPILSSDHNGVRIDLSRIRVDVLDRLAGRATRCTIVGDFLEGFDIAGEEGFEDWLRDTRATLAERLANAPAAAPPPAAALPTRIVDLAAAPAGFGGRPAIAVLPFANRTGDAAQDYVAGGFSMELSDRLARLRWMPVIAASTGFAFRATALGPVDLAAAIGACYLVEGNVLARDGGLVVQAYLVDGGNGRMIWSQRHALPHAVSQPVIDDIVRDLVAALDSRVVTAEQDRVLHRHVDGLTVDELVWRARWHLTRMTRADAEVARTLLDQALALRPNSVDALVQAAFGMAWTIWTGRRSAADIRAMRAVALRAIAADAFDARGHLLVGMAETWLRETARARLSLDHAIALNPSEALAYAQLGSALYLGGDPERGIAAMRMALRLNPHDSQAFCVLAEMGVAHLMTGARADAIAFAEYAITRRPAYWYAHVVKIAALVADGDVAGATEAHRALLVAAPTFAATHIDWLPFVDAAWPDRFREALRRSDPG